MENEAVRMVYGGNPSTRYVERKPVLNGLGSVPLRLMPGEAGTLTDTLNRGMSLRRLEVRAEALGEGRLDGPDRLVEVRGVRAAPTAVYTPLPARDLDQKYVRTLKSSDRGEIRLHLFGSGQDVWCGETIGLTVRNVSPYVVEVTAGLHGVEMGYYPAHRVETATSEPAPEDLGLGGPDRDQGPVRPIDMLPLAPRGDGRAVLPPGGYGLFEAILPRSGLLRGFSSTSSPSGALCVRSIALAGLPIHVGNGLIPLEMLEGTSFDLREKIVEGKPGEAHEGRAGCTVFLEVYNVSDKPVDVEIEADLEYVDES